MSWSTDQRTTQILEQSRSAGLQSAIAQGEAEAAASKARLAAEQAAAATRAAQSGSSHDRQIISALRSAVEAEQKISLERQIALEATQKALQEKNDLLLEWMHSNDAFKKLVGQYGKKLGLTDEQIKSDRKEAVLDLAEEDPRYQATKLSQKARQP